MGKETMKKVCILCGAPLQGGRKYCPSCGKKMRIQTMKAAHERRKAGMQKSMNLPSVRKKCMMCGKDFDAWSNRVQFCDDCRKERERLTRLKRNEMLKFHGRGKKTTPKDTLEDAMRRLKDLNEKRQEQGLSFLSYGKAVQQGLI